MTSQTLTLARPTVALAHATQAPRARLAYIDNIRILLVILVIVHHVAITYGAQGGWHYYERGADTITTAVLTLLVAVNQAFFMAFYFAIAGHFAAQSLERKGVRRFLKDRLLRLGVPLAFQLLVTAPLLSYGLGITIWGFEGSFWTYIAAYWKDNWGSLDTGPLWFVEALPIFSVAYGLWWWLVKPSARDEQPAGNAPSNLAMALLALSMGLATFTVRIWLPVGWFFAPLNLAIPSFVQYVSLFILGTVAYRHGWLSAISEDTAKGKLWRHVVAVLLVMAPVVLAVGGGLEGNITAFLGGVRWQAFFYALWEQFVCVGMIVSMLCWFRQRHDRQGRLAKGLSNSAYATYVFHAPVLVFVSIGLRDLSLPSMLKFGLVSLICIPACFLVGTLVGRVPWARTVL